MLSVSSRLKRVSFIHVLVLKFSAHPYLIRSTRLSRAQSPKYISLRFSLLFRGPKKILLRVQTFSGSNPKKNAEDKASNRRLLLPQKNHEKQLLIPLQKKRHQKILQRHWKCVRGRECGKVRV